MEWLRIILIGLFTGFSLGLGFWTAYWWVRKWWR